MGGQENLNTFLAYANNRHLATIEKQNQAQLQQAALQNLQMQQLNQQIAHANNINTQLLENQLNQLQEENTQKFYKDMIFLISNLIEEVEQIDEPLLKIFFYKIIEGYSKNNLDIAMDILNEIHDKNSAKNLLKKISSLGKEIHLLQSNNKFDQSLFQKHIHTNTEYSDLVAALETSETSIEKPIEPTKPEDKVASYSTIIFCFIAGAISITFVIGVFIIGFGIFLFVKRKQYINEYKILKSKYDDELNRYNIKIKNTSIDRENKNKKMDSYKNEIELLEKQIEAKYNKYSIIKESIESLIGKFNKKWS